MADINSYTYRSVKSHGLLVGTIKPVWATGAMAQHLRVPAALEEDQSVIPTWQLTSICSSSSREPSVLLYTRCTYSEVMHAYTWVQRKSKWILFSSSPQHLPWVISQKKDEVMYSCQLWRMLSSQGHPVLTWDGRWVPFYQSGVFTPMLTCLHVVFCVVLSLTSCSRITGGMI